MGSSIKTKFSDHMIRTIILRENSHFKLVDVKNEGFEKPYPQAAGLAIDKYGDS